MLTSFGTYLGIKASVKFKYKKDSLDGLSIVVQGLGSVGMELVKYLSQDGMKIFAYDIDADRLNLAKKEYGVIPMGKMKYTIKMSISMHHVH